MLHLQLTLLFLQHYCINKLNLMFQSLNSSKADTLGAATSGLCAIHCIITPFIFLAKAGSAAMHVDPPVWYQLIDYLFIIISFVAIHYATKNSTKNWMRISLWSTWGLLLVAILNETFEVIPLPEASVYIPALVIAGLHLYNQKYCRCEGNCCT